MYFYKSMIHYFPQIHFLLFHFDPIQSVHSHNTAADKASEHSIIKHTNLWLEVRLVILLV